MRCWFSVNVNVCERVAEDRAWWAIALELDQTPALKQLQIAGPANPKQFVSAICTADRTTCESQQPLPPRAIWQGKSRFA